MSGSSVGLLLPVTHPSGRALLGILGTHSPRMSNISDEDAPKIARALEDERETIAPLRCRGNVVKVIVYALVLIWLGPTRVRDLL